MYHILNGDSLALRFPDAHIEGDVIIFREAFIEGDVSGNSLHDLWQSRARFMGLTEEIYRNQIVTELEKIGSAPDDSVFNLWFEYDLFCQVNMWFVISMIKNLSIRKKVYAVYTSYLHPTHNQFWNGFGQANAADLKICYDGRILLSEVELQLGHDLWTAYKSNNLEELIRLSKIPSPAFPYLQQVVNAHAERFPKDGIKGRPERVLEDIIKNRSTDFHKVFEEFWNRESIYGFGDVQLRHLYDKVMSSI